MQIYMQPNLVLTPEQVATAKTQAELLEKAAALVRMKAEEGARRYQLEQLRKQVEEGERARSVSITNVLLAPLIIKPHRQLLASMEAGTSSIPA